MPLIYIGIGSNRGARALNIRRGLQLLADRGFRILKQSPIYETDPVNMPGARTFLNAVALARTRLSPDACLGAFRAIEARLGRPARHPRYAPRTLDLDLLLYGRVVRRSHGFSLPHPEMHRRAFVLIPLADIAPNLVHPVLRRRISTLLKQIPREGVRRMETPVDASKRHPDRRITTKDTKNTRGNLRDLRNLRMHLERAEPPMNANPEAEFSPPRHQDTKKNLRNLRLSPKKRWPNN